MPSLIRDSEDGGQRHLIEHGESIAVARRASLRCLLMPPTTPAGIAASYWTKASHHMRCVWGDRDGADVCPFSETHTDVRSLIMIMVMMMMLK